MKGFVQVTDPIFLGESFGARVRDAAGLARKGRDGPGAWCGGLCCGVSLCVVMCRGVLWWVVVSCGVWWCLVVWRT